MWRLWTFLAVFIASGSAVAAGRLDTGLAPDDVHDGPSAGLRVYYDPVTQQLLDHPATLEQQQTMQHALPAPDYSRFRTTILPDGATLLEFDGQIEMTSVAHLHADGTVTMDCAAHAAESAEPTP